MEKYKSRKDVPEKYKWNLNDFYHDLKEFDEEFKNVSKIIPKLIKFRGCTKNPTKLLEFLKLELETVSRTENLYVYSFLYNDQELGNPDAIKRKASTCDLYTKLSQNISFFAPELLELSPKEYEDLFVKNPDLEEFKADLDKIYRDKDHTLNEREKNIISELTNAMDNFDDTSSNMLSKEHNYGKVKLPDNTNETIATNNYRFLLKNADRDVRKKTYQKFNKVLDQYGSTSASLLNSYVKECNALAKIHYFNNSWEQKLFNLNMPNEAYKALVETTENNVWALQEYLKLKEDILGLDKIHFYDITVDMINSKKEYSIEEAQDLILNAIKPLGKDYYAKMEKIFTNRYIDYCQYKGKCSGGYSFATLDHDSRILMSFNGELSSVSTIAHEGGHNVHHQYQLEHNKPEYRGNANVVCEVASLTNECLLSAYLAKNAKTKEEKLAGIGNIIDVIISNLFGAVREGKIEQDFYEYVNKGGTLTKEYLNKLTAKSFKKYFGEELGKDKYIGCSWINRSHYFMNYYLYSYAISISVATNVASKILDGDKTMLDNYIKFLSTGNDVWPIDTFKILGVDLTDSKVYENAINYFADLVKQYKEIYYE